MKVVILAGGMGTRLAEETVTRPKPMVEIGGRPIIWHIMKHYAHYGFKEFVIALGYKGEMIKRYFHDYFCMNGSVSISLTDGTVEVHDDVQEDWLVHLVETGLLTNTGGRLQKLRSWLDEKTFMLTYGDGVCNVDLQKLLQFHSDNGKLVTVTAVRPPARFGSLEFTDGDLITRFVEKPLSGGGWINGGFFVVEREALDYIEGDQPWESEPLRNIAADGQLVAYRHDDFWQCMDTYRELKILEKYWQSGSAPWKIW
ncbi:MAG: glucose-1-phosphate cytidylyltransferase [Firmicutes bacterium ML8_F2]|jgi:glucose-1-phosphate cytidylyltransferase|nr:MAG: glucose-1-phosphate cytidylyltransferase [Firmicutes bacterium ML8_F2]